MAKTVTTTIRLDEELKKELTHDLDIMRLNINAYFTMAAKQLVLVLKKKIPFEISTSSNDIPNETTRKAMILAEAKELGLIPDDSPRFSNVDDMMEFLDGE